MPAPTSSPANSGDSHVQRDRHSARNLSRVKAVGITTILLLAYVGLILLGRKCGSKDHHAGGSHTRSKHAPADEGDPQRGEGKTPQEERHDRARDDSRSGDHHHSSDHNRSGGHQNSDDRSRSPSVRSILIASTMGYLALLALWAGLLRRWAFLLRHVVTAAALWLIVVQYLNARGSFEYNVHSWNRTFADASVILYAVTLAIGPLARLWGPAIHALAWRRETGIWGTLAAVVHIALFWGKHYGWDGWRLFFYPAAHGSGAIAHTLMGDRSIGLSPAALNLANVIGLVALAYALVLAVTSNDASQHWLRRGWTWLQERATTMYLLVLLHTWLFAYYITVENTLAIGTLWASFWTVLLLQTAAFVKTVWFRQRPEERPRAETTPEAHGHGAGKKSAIHAPNVESL